MARFSYSYNQIVIKLYKQNWLWFIKKAPMHEFCSKNIKNDNIFRTTKGEKRLVAQTEIIVIGNHGYWLLVHGLLKT